MICFFALSTLVQYRTKGANRSNVMKDSLAFPNVQGSYFFFFSLTFVSVPPTITHRSNKTIDVEEGVNVTLHCDAIGDPTPSVVWVKDDKTLQNSTSTSTLQISRIELRDAGTYVCTAANQAGSTSYSVQVRVVRCKLTEINSFSPKYIQYSYQPVHLFHRVRI